MSNRLPHETEIGRVALYVTELERSVRYYRDNIGFAIHERNGDFATMGAGGKDLLVLYELPNAQPVQQRRTGLYHFAILVPSRRALAKTLRHLADTQTRIDGASDHGVSEAIYLSDPDGHGIEIYRDRDRSEWPFANGMLQMVLDPLQTQEIMAEFGPGQEEWDGLEAATVIGHVHLHERDLAEAEHFYVSQIGLDMMQRFGNSASFVSAGGYHHHLGLNVWAGVGAPQPDSDRARLRWYEIRLPDKVAAEKLVDRLAGSGVAISELDEEAWSVSDPSGTDVHFVVA